MGECCLVKIIIEVKENDLEFHTEGNIPQGTAIKMLHAVMGAILNGDVETEPAEQSEIIKEGE
jgi:hypothetical protein